MLVAYVDESYNAGHYFVAAAVGHSRTWDQVTLQTRSPRRRRTVVNLRATKKSARAAIGRAGSPVSRHLSISRVRERRQDFR